MSKLNAMEEMSQEKVEVAQPSEKDVVIDAAENEDISVNNPKEGAPREDTNNNKTAPVEESNGAAIRAPVEESNGAAIRAPEEDYRWRRPDSPHPYFLPRAPLWVGVAPREDSIPEDSVVEACPSDPEPEPERPVVTGYDSDDSSGKDLYLCCFLMSSLSAISRCCAATSDLGKRCFRSLCCCFTWSWNKSLPAQAEEPLEIEDEPEKEPEEEVKIEEPPMPEEIPPTPPTMEEVVAWGQNFEEVMRSNAGRKFFRDFLRGEYSEENILFWLSCQELKKVTDPDIIKKMTKHIYEEYISVLSPKEVSLDSAVREITNQNMTAPTVNSFDEAQLQIYTLMRRDSYPRFVNSNLYKTLLALYIDPQ